MGEIGALYVSIGAKITDLQTALAEVKKELGGTQQEVKKADSSFGGLWKQFAIGQIVADALKRGFALLKDAVRDSIGAAAEAETADNNLTNALATTGRTIPPLLEHFQGYARELQKQTVYDDEAIKGAQALLLQLTNLDQRGIDRATKGAIGLASVMGTDLRSATMMVTKAMEGNYGALSRVGIKVAENLPAHEKQAALLDQLGNLYARAQGETDTFAGSLSQLKNSWGEVQETMGAAIIKNESLRDAMKGLNEWVMKLAESDDFKLWLDAVVQGITATVKLIGKMISGVQDLTEWAFKATKADREYEEQLKKLQAALQRNKEAGGDLGDVLDHQKKIAEELAPVINEVGKSHGALKTATEKLVDTQLEQYNLTALLKRINAEYSTTLIDTAIPAVNDLNGALGVVAESMGGIPKAAEPALQETKNYFDGLYNDIATGWADTIQKWLEGTTTFKDFLLGIWGDIKSAFFRVIGEMAAEWAIGFVKNIISGAGEAAKGITDTIGSALGGVGKTVGSVAGGLLSSLGSIGSIISGITSVIELFKGPQKQTDVTYWLKLIKDNSQIIVNYLADTLVPATHNIEMLSYNMRDFLNDIKLTSWDQTQKLYEIAENTHGTWAALKNVTKGAGGIDMTVSKPTLFMAGEGSKTERVTINPNLNVSSAPVVINLDGRAIAHAIVKFFPEMGRNKTMRIHSNALVEY